MLPASFADAPPTAGVASGRGGRAAADETRRIADAALEPGPADEDALEADLLRLAEAAPDPGGWLVE
jgi:hypothetical protein